MRKFIGACVLAALVAALAVLIPEAAAQNDTEWPPPADTVTAAVVEIEPFVMRQGDRPTGFYWEIWEDVALDMGVAVEVVWVDSFDELLETVASGEADVAVAPLAPTSARELRLDFSSAVVSSGPQLGVHERLDSGASVLKALVASRVLRLILLAVLGLVVLGHLIWFAERNDEENNFHPGYVRGVWDGVWWAAATITTVGYGDKAPTSTRGRIVAMIAMLASLFLVGAFVTEVSRDVATQRSEQGITSVDTIGNRSVAVVDGSTFAEYVESQGVNTIALPNQSEAFDAVAAGTADVVLASPFALSNLGDEHGVRAVGTVLYEEFESFGLTQGSPWREPINAVLADLQSTGVIQATIDRWID